MTVRDPPVSALAHIPGTEGWPLIGNTLQYLADPKGTAERFAKLYGQVHRSYSFGGRTVSLLGPDANEFVLLDQGKFFSSEHGWDRVFGLLFPRGLMMRDFDEHRVHRRALAVAFKPRPMKSYLQKLDQGIATGISTWLNASPSFRFYPAIKRLTLDLAAVSFLGDECGPDLDAIKHAYADMIAACVGVVRRPIPGTQMSRGVKARKFMIDYLGGQIAARRANDGHDLFTQLCKTTTDDGALLTPQEVLDHMNFLMMAAHDTLASSLTSFVYFLAVNPDWQEKLREEVNALGLTPGEPLPYERLDELPLVEMAFNESLRLIPPAPSILRRAVRDMEFGGFHIPQGTHIAVNALYTHHMPDVWPEPEKFDPLRFTDEAIAARHKYAFIAFGGGAHTCLGLRFAYMQAKCFAYHLLSTAVISVPPNYKPSWKYWPIPLPRDGLRVNLMRVR
ncbi:MAG: cytochrome P450 [Alphaproteobacteria bacterium]|nr:cytochrome P450 [Alphaproteobacteria bacterium]